MMGHHGFFPGRPLSFPLLTSSRTVRAPRVNWGRVSDLKCLRCVLIDLGYPQDNPTILWEDNDATIKIVNNNRPTPRSRHVEIRYFGLQHWRLLEEIIMKHIPGIINPSDSLTKALGWVLHERHTRFMMGHHGFFPGCPLSFPPTN